MEDSHSQNDVATDIARAQLILAEKRTSLSVVRTAIAVIALPLSVITALIALSRYYDVIHNLPLLVPLLLICLGLTIIGVYLFTRALRKINHYDHLLHRLKRRDPEISDLLD